MESYCPKCQTQTLTEDVTYDFAPNKKAMMKGRCVTCYTRKSSFITKVKKEGDGVCKTSSHLSS